MYTYYCLAMFKNLQPYLWWKKYITQLQLFQFVLVFLHSTYFLLDKECECPKPLTFLQSAHAVLFFCMFYSFYMSAYQKEQKLKKAKLLEQLNKLEMKPKQDNAQIKKLD